MISQADLNAADVLEAAARILSGGWTTGAMARDSNGLPIHATSPYAVCWCASGAIVLASFRMFPMGGVTQHRACTDAGALLLAYVRNLARAGDLISVAEWNDTAGRQRADVTDACLRVCERIRAGAPVHAIRGNDTTGEDLDGDGGGS